MPEAPLHIVTRLGSEGDGVVEPDGIAAAFVPFVLPGETVAADAAGGFHRTGAASTERIVPPCRHFGACGGCAVQHMSPRLYRRWKRDLLVAALRQHGLSPPIDDLVTIEPGTRRRAVLSASRVGKAIQLGYHQRRSHTIVDLAECPVLAPVIVGMLPLLRTLLAPIVPAKGELRVIVSALTDGIDIAVETGDVALTAAARTRLAQSVAVLAKAAIARLAVDGEIIVAHAEPTIDTVGGAIVPPPGAFFQAVATAEREIAGRAVAGIGKAKRIADLFAGVGTFSLALARVGRVLAVDNAPEMLSALAVAARHAQGLKPIETKLRDLVGEPLSVKELEGFDAAVLDPPRAGAKAQAMMLARSKVKRVVMIACNPATFARDLSILVDGGYKIERVTPIDQFLWSAHLESVAVLAR